MERRRAGWGWIAALGCVLALSCSQKPLHRFQHEPHVSGGVACTKCHEGTTDEKRMAPALPQTKTCKQCHRKPHPKKGYIGECLTCHSVITHQAVTGVGDTAPLRFSHPNHLKRQRGQCFPCHSSVVKKATHADRVRPTMSSCFTCHNHKREWENLECGSCHTTLRFYKLKMVSHFAHAGEFSRQHGKVAVSRAELCAQCHTQSFCTTCHGTTRTAIKPSVRWPQAIDRGFIHRGDFIERHPIEARGSSDSCVRCHAQSDCSSCHEKVGVFAGSKRSPHPAGWVSVTGGSNLHGKKARREILACASCHDRGASSNCVMCHRPGGVGGNPHPPGFKSRLSKTSDAVCKVCH